ncbi:MAG: hypothetical protein ACJ71Q_14530 [Terriglobales bacterium]
MKKPPQLTSQEEQAREKALDFYRYTGKSEEDANRMAWADIKKEFPRLSEYDLSGDSE